MRITKEVGLSTEVRLSRPNWRGRNGGAILAGVVLWTIYGLFSASLTHYRYHLSSKPLTWPRALFIEVSYAYVAGALSPLVVLLANRFRLQGPHRIRNLGIHLCGTFVYGVSANLFWSFLTRRGPFENGHFTPARLLLSLDWALDFAVLLYWLIVLLHYAHDYYQRYEASLIYTANLNAQLAHAQLQALKMQLHPHFLFNTLHAISELVHEDPGAAERMIVGLSQLLRLSLETSADVEVPLSQELRFVELYLDIERVRFEHRLDVDIRIEPELREALVPNLILQPLLENAIKHGISHRTEGGKIILTARKDNESLVLSVRDNGSGLVSNGNYREGVGLGTTRARLEKLYGRNQSLHFITHKHDGVEASIRLPYKIRSVEALKIS